MREPKPPETWLNLVCDDGLWVIAEVSYDDLGNEQRGVRMLYDSYRVRPTMTGHGADIRLGPRELEKLQLVLGQAACFLDLGATMLEHLSPKLGWNKAPEGR